MKILYNVLDRHAFSRNQVEVFLNGVVGDLEAKLCTHLFNLWKELWGVKC